MTSESGERSPAFASASVPDEYERHLVPTVFAPWAGIVLDTVAVAPGTQVRQGAAPIEYLEASADELPFEDGRFDVVLCQQGLQFFPQRETAVGEMRRVLRRGGIAGIAVGATGHPLEPFGVYGEELAALGAEAPFPRTFESETFTMSVETIRSLLQEAGFSAVDAGVVELEVSWPDTASVVAGALGTPFGPLVHARSPDLRQQFEAELEKRFAPEGIGAPVRRRTAAVIARATAA
jgi:SAM-dependent methyltransferase